MDDLKKTLEYVMAPSRAGGAGERNVPGETSMSNKTSMSNGRAGVEDQTDVCPHCRGRGVIIGPDDVAVRCSCMDVQQLNNRIKSARLSRELMKCRLDTFDFSYYGTGVTLPGKGGKNSKDDGNGKDSKDGKDGKNGEHMLNARKAWQAARDFVDGVLQDPHHIGLMYSGQAGAGKTWLAASIANELICQNRNVLFVVVPDLLDELRATYNRKDVSEYDILDMAKTIPILILDDLGAHNYTDWAINRIYSILNYRVNEKLPLIVTTNLHHGDIAVHLGERTSSRLLQMCRLFKLTVSQDIREQQYIIREKQRL